MMKLASGVSSLALVAVGLSAAQAADTVIGVNTSLDQIWTLDDFKVSSGVTLSSAAPVATSANVGTLTVDGTIEEVDPSNTGGAVGIFSGGVVDAIDIALGGRVTGAYRGIENSQGTVTAITNAGTVSAAWIAVSNYDGEIGSIVNKGDMSAARYVILNEAATIGSITNTSTGRLIGTADRAQGISNNGTITGNIVNDGLIESLSTTVNDYGGSPEANPTGINNIGSVKGLINNGTIRAGGTSNGVGIVNSATSVGTDTSGWATITTLTNAGTIEVNSANNTRSVEQGYAVGIENTYGIITKLTNSGTITSVGKDDGVSGTDSANAYGIENYGRIYALTNTGTIDAKIESGPEGVAYGIRNRGASASRPTSEIDVLTNSGTIRSTDYGIYSTGIIDKIDNSGTISGKYGIYGTGANADLGTIVNSGKITGSVTGIMLSTASSITNSGLIQGGTSALPTTSIKFGVGGNTLNILPTAEFIGVVDYSSTTGNTTTFGTGSYHIPVANYLDAGNSIVLNNSGQFKVLDAASGAGGHIDVVAVPTTGRSATQYTASVSNVISSILSLDVARPDSSGTAPGAALGYGETEQRSDEAKALRELGEGTAMDAYGNMFWARAFGGIRYQGSDGAAPSSTVTHLGVISGIDRQFDGLRFGFFGGGGIVRSSTGSDASTLSGDTGFAGFYGATHFGDVAFNASLTAGGIANSSSRSINNGAETARGDFNGWYVSPELALSRDYAMSGGWELTPSVKARYTGSFYQGYDETGSSQNVSYDAQQSHSLDGRLQLELKRRFVQSSGLPGTVSMSAALSDTQYIGSSTVRASIANNEFTVANGGDRNVLGASLGLGFDLQTTEAAAVYGGIEASVYSDDTVAATGRLGFKVAF